MVALNQMISNAKEIVCWPHVNVVPGMLRLNETVDFKELFYNQVILNEI